MQWQNTLEIRRIDARLVDNHIVFGHAIHTVPQFVALYPPLCCLLRFDNEGICRQFQRGLVRQVNPLEREPVVRFLRAFGARRHIRRNIRVRYGHKIKPPLLCGFRQLLPASLIPRDCDP